MDKQRFSDKLEAGDLKMSQKYDEKCEEGAIAEGLSELADFETAITATRFGKFNIMLFLIALPSALASEFDFTAMSYVLPAAQCDLEMTLLHKGMLNAVTYLGTIISAFFWGFIADTLGRRNILIYGYFIDAFFVLLSSVLSQNFWVLFVIKFINGLVICGPYAVLMSYISEFHSARYRAPILLLSGIFFCLANVALSGLAWWIIPQNISFSLFNEYVEIHSWQVFMMVCSVPSLVSGCAYLFFPESPKFLMTSGRNSEALEVFQRVYSMNTGNPPEYFPIKRLVEETSRQENKKVTRPEKVGNGMLKPETTMLRSVSDGWKQIRPIFAPPYLMRIVHIFSILFLGMLGENTLRLWLPQLFTKIDEYNQMVNYTKTAGFCEMLATTNNYTESIMDQVCTVTIVDNQVYINTIIVALTNALGFIVASFIVNKVGRKFLLVVIYAVCGFTGVGNYWSTSSTMTLILVSIYGGICSVSTSTIITVIVDLFPTTLRTMTISLGMMAGRTGSIIGNVLFPVLLETGCLPPFLLIGGTALVCSLCCMFLPNLKMKSLD